MASNSDNANTFVFEYRGETDSTEAAFDRLLSTVSEDTPEITGFRLELTTADAFHVPLDELASQETTPDEPATTQDDGEAEAQDSREDADRIPSLQTDALPAQVLSRMLERDDEPVRTSELEGEFTDDEIDTARISQTLASLKRRELVEAKPDPEDNRANIYWATEKGQQALND